MERLICCGNSKPFALSEVKYSTFRDMTWHLSYRSFSLSRSKKIYRKPFSGWSQEIVILLKINKEDTSPSFRSVRSPKPQIFVEMFRRNLQSFVWKRHVGAHQMCTNMAAGNSVNIWILRWLSRRLTVCAQQTNIYISTFPNALTSEKATNHEIGKYFWTNGIVALCHAPP